MKLLITGFEPFGGRAVNTSADLVAHLRNQAQQGDVTRVYSTLPVDFRRTWPHLKRVLKEEKPDGLVMLGEKSGTGMWIETGADNHRRTARGHGVIRRAGPGRLENPLPVREWQLAAVRALGLKPSPVAIELSSDAGDYLCNFTYFKVLSEVAPLPALFIHVGAHEPAEFLRLRAAYAAGVDFFCQQLGQRQS